AGTRSAGDRTAAPRQRGASLRSRSGTGAPRPVPTGRPAGPAPAAGRTPRPAAHRTPEDERLLRDARTGHRRRGRRSASGRLVVLDAPQQVPDPEGVQRGKGVPRVAGEPSGAAQAHRVSAGPEVLPAVVPVPDAPGGDDR